jgi:hypothetical protein
MLNIAEQTIDFKTIAEAIAKGAREAGIDQNQQHHIATRVAGAISNAAEDAQICFDEDAFIEFATER